MTAEDDQIVANLEQLQCRVAKAARACGRKPSEIRILPVSKTKPTSAVLAAYRLGYRRFGENLVQQAQLKASELAAVEDLEWSLIGHLQTNKARQVASFATEFQALDSLRLARELDRRLHAESRQLEVLVQVNSSGESQKFGLPPQEVLGFVKELRAFDALVPRGLMTLAVRSAQEEPVAACFEVMRSLQVQLREIDESVGKELSMGMSGDFELAITHGATCLRLGQAAFGPRVIASEK